MLKLPFEVFLAFRYLRPKRTFVSVITLISTVGVMLGVAVLIVVISVMTGFDRQLREKILGFKPHLRIVGGSALANYPDLVSMVSSNRYVKGVAPYVMGQVMVQSQPSDGAAMYLWPVIRGVNPDPELEAKVSVLPSSIVSGTYDLTGNRILVGRELAMGMKLKVGDSLSIYSVGDLRHVAEIRKRIQAKQDVDDGFLPVDFEISGIFDVGYYEFNDFFIVASLANAQDLSGLEDEVQGLAVTLLDPEDAHDVRAELLGYLPLGLSISTWEEENSEILDALLVEKHMMFYLLFFIMIVAAFGIMSNLITFVVQKTREIGILKAVGASGGQVMSVFFSQGLMVGVFGVTAGLGLGLMAVWYRNEFLFFLRRVTGIEIFPKRIYSFSELPALIDPLDIAVICGISLFACLLAGVLPALYAAWLKPVEALRYE